MQTGSVSVRVLGGYLTLALAFGVTARAQDSTQATPLPTPARPGATTAIVTGTVISAQDSEPLKGVQVLVKGTRHWAITNPEGGVRLDRVQACPL